MVDHDLGACHETLERSHFPFTHRLTAAAFPSFSPFFLRRFRDIRVKRVPP